MPFEKCVVLVMAAGFSKRFGADDKRRALLPSGRSLLMTSAEQVREVFPLWRLVLRSDDDLRDFRLPVDTPVIRAPGAPGGLGCSVADAFNAISRDPDLSGVEAAAVFLGDMPFVRPGTWRSLMEAAERSQILRPCCSGRVGHPVIFGREFWPELNKLEGDTGAQSVIHRNALRYREIEVDDPGIFLDIDTPEDLAKHSPVC